MTISSKSILKTLWGKSPVSLSMAVPKNIVQTDIHSQQMWVEKVLSTIWCQVLELPQVDTHANFFDLGGDALRAAQVLSLAHVQGVHFSLGQFVDYPTISDMAQQIISHR